MKLKATYSLWGSEITFWVPQNSILGPLLFNIFLCDLFQFFSDLDIAYYADDNTAHSNNINLNKALHNLEKESNTFTLRARNNKSKLTLMEWPSPTVNVKLGIHIDLL